MRVSLIAIALFLAAGCNSSATPLTIGHVAPFSGADKELADQAANGIRLAIDDYAAPKPIRPIVVRHADGKGDLEVTEGQAVRLVTLNHAFVILGGQDALEATRLDRAGALLLSPIGKRAKAMSELAIATGVSPARLGKVLAQFLNDSLKPTATVLLVEPGEETIATEAAFSAAWAEAKHPVPGRQEVGDSASDAFKKWSEALPKDVLPIVISSPAMLKALALESPLRDRPLAYAGPEVARQPLKGRAVPVYLVSAFGGDGEAAKFAERYQAKFHGPAEPHAAIAYDDARLAIEVLKKALPPVKLREELLALKEFSGLTGTFKIADGAVERPAFVGRLEKGRFIE